MKVLPSRPFTLFVDLCCVITKSEDQFLSESDVCLKRKNFLATNGVN